MKISRVITMRLFKLYDTTALSRVYLFDVDDFVYGKKKRLMECRRFWASGISGESLF